MIIRLLMTGLLLIGGMRGLQACIGDAGHFHFEIGHSHTNHCGEHSHSGEQRNPSPCEHSHNHSHIDFTIDEPLNLPVQRLALIKGQPQVLATLFPGSVYSLASSRQVVWDPSEIPRLGRSAISRKMALSTVVLRL